MTNIILTICTILIAVISSIDISIEKIILSSLLTILGIFGYAFSMKHYERFSWHQSCSNLYREKIHQEFPDTIIDRASANEKLKMRFGWIHKSRLFKYWTSIQIVISAIGLTVLTLSIVQYIN